MYENLRKKYHLSKKELSEKIGVQPSAITKTELGKTKPNFDTLKLIYKTFGIEEVENLFKENRE